MWLKISCVIDWLSSTETYFHAQCKWSKRAKFGFFVVVKFIHIDSDLNILFEIIHPCKSINCFCLRAPASSFAHLFVRQHAAALIGGYMPLILWKLRELFVFDWRPNSLVENATAYCIRNRRLCDDNIDIHSVLMNVQMHFIGTLSAMTFMTSLIKARRREPFKICFHRYASAAKEACVCRRCQINELKVSF